MRLVDPEGRGYWRHLLAAAEGRPPGSQLDELGGCRVASKLTFCFADSRPAIHVRKYW